MVCCHRNNEVQIAKWELVFFFFEMAEWVLVKKEFYRLNVKNFIKFRSVCFVGESKRVRNDKLDS